MPFCGKKDSQTGQGQKEGQRETGKPNVPENLNGDFGGTFCGFRSRELHRARSDPNVAVP